MKMYELFLTCPKGLEKICEQDLSSLELSNIKILDGAITFNGSLKDLYNVNLNSRVGMNLLLKLTSFSFKNIDDYYRKIYSYDWNYVLTPNMTFAISTNIIGENRFFNNSQFGSLKAKDAIADKLISTKKRRPNVDKLNPDLSVKIIIKNTTCDVYINSSGNPLYIRGYKNKTHKAPINEALAAGLILSSDWNQDENLIDPMCGSGTFCTEASMIKRNIPPGINRNFSFQKWLDYDVDLFKALYKKSLKNIDQSSKNTIFGSDIEPSYIDGCKEILNRFRYNLGIKFETKNISGASSNQSVIITNPPYGKRIEGEKSMSFIDAGLKKLLKNKNRIYVVYPSDNDFIKSNYEYKIIANIYNGPIPCQFYKLHND